MKLELKRPSTDTPARRNTAALKLLINLTKAINAAQGWHQHPRNGKIARLPVPTRTLINQMLLDGLPYRDILDNLRHSGDLPYSLSEMNISNWYHGGYRDWLRDKSKTAGGPPILQQLAALEIAANQRPPPETPAALPSPLAAKPATNCT